MSKSRPTVTIKGDISAANVNFGEQTFHGAVTFTYNGAPAASDEVAARLESLMQQLADALTAVPAEQASDAKAVKLAAEDALQEAEKDEPDKDRLQIRGDLLVAAAKNLATVAPIAVEIARTLLMIG